MRRRLLVLGESSESGTDLTLSLKALGYEIDLLGFGQVCPDAWPEHDLILVRMHEPRDMGLRALSTFRSQPYYPPMIAITESENPSQTAMLLECGCDCVLGASRDVLQVKA